MAWEEGITPPETEKSSASRVPQRTRKQLANMEELASAAKATLNYIEHSDKRLQDEFVIGFVKQVQQFAAQAQNGVGNPEGLAGFQRLLEQVHQDTEMIRKEISTNKHSAQSDSSSFWKSFQAREWQRGLVNAVAPLSQSAGSSTPGVTPSELGLDSEIVVKVRDATLRSELKKMKPVDIVKRAESARAQAAKSTPSLALAGHAFIAARQLPSGDISLRAQNAASAEILRQHAEGWVGAFGVNAWVRVPTWGVVVDGVPARSMDLDKGNEDLKLRIAAQNHHIWGRGVKIVYLGWLVKPRREFCSLVIEFTSPLVANKAILKGMVWEHSSLTARPYCREGRCRMCMKCQRYGHAQTQCPAKDFTCGICAEGHPTWECRSKQGKDKNATPKCANCKGAHKAVSDACPVRKEAVGKAKAALYSCERLHRIPEHWIPKNDTNNFPALGTAPAPTKIATPNAPATRRSEDRQTAPVPLDIERRRQDAERQGVVFDKPTIRKATRPRGRPKGSKSISSTGQEPLPDMEGPIQAALSATQSTVSSTAPAPPKRQRRGELVKMFSEPEKLLRKPVSKRSLEAGTQPEPVQTREPQLPPPLPEITMDEGGDNIILNSEASFRELQPEQPSETGFLTLLNQFTNTPRTGDNLVPIGPPRSSPQRPLIQSKPEPPMESEIDSNSSLSSLSDADDEADDPMDVTFVPRARTKTPPKHFS